MYISVSRITGAPPQAVDRMVQGFRHGAPDLKQFKGFLGFELWRNESGLEAVSRWESEAAMKEYTNSPAFTAHHGGPPSGGQQPAGAQPGPSGSVFYYDAEVVI